jgi:hypothetical protein
VVLMMTMTNGFRRVCLAVLSVTSCASTLEYTWDTNSSQTTARSWPSLAYHLNPTTKALTAWKPYTFG